MSKVEVNTIEPQCGTTVTVGKCTSTVAVPGNVVKSNALQASDGGNIVSQSGTTITLGASGDSKPARVHISPPEKGKIWLQFLFM